MSCCPTCRRPLPDALAQLRDACEAKGIVPDWRDTIREDEAALLLGKSAWTLMNWRRGSRPLAFIKVGGRIRYELHAIAGFLEKCRDVDD